MDDEVNSYRPLEKALHRVALAPQFMRRVSFDLECALAPEPSHPARAPTYVAGLARAGTTVLLEALYHTGDFVTLTYRSMPFVLAPTLWRKLSGAHRRQSELAERAHGDRLLVGFDSPEAFEEVFWMTATNKAFVNDNALHEHTPDDDALVDYRRFVSNVAAMAEKAGKRYLAKNNNNLLRLASLKRAFPDARIVVPYRNPYDHANSLLKQHLQFCETHRRDPFSRKYMSWLGHFEFGLDLKPFQFGSDVGFAGSDPTSLNYWIEYWAYVYENVLNKHSNDVLLFDYDLFCLDPTASLDTLAAFTDVDADHLKRFASRVEPGGSYGSETTKVSERARLVHEQLLAHSATAICD